MFFEFYLIVMMYIAYLMLSVLFYDILLNKSDKLILLNVIAKENVLVTFSATILCLVAWPIMILVALIIYLSKSF
jgi:hypothetical protein